MTITIITLIALFLIVVIYVFSAFRRMKKMPHVQNHPKIKVLNTANFDSQVKKGVTMVDFWASWCMPCKMVAPILNEVAEEAPANALVAKVDIDSNKELAARYGIRSIPTIVVFRNGREVERIVGIKPKATLLKILENYK